MKHDLWAPRRRIEKRYQNSLEAALGELEKIIAPLKSPDEIFKAIFNFAESSVFEEFARAAATHLITSLFADNGRTWREAARANSLGLNVYEALRNEMFGGIGIRVHELVDDNARLIKTLPKDIGNQVAHHIQGRAYTGLRAEELAEEIKAFFPERTHASAELIARTETSKAGTALTQARAEEIGLDWYIWETSEDQRVRTSHRHMQGVLIRWSDPPSPEALIHEENKGKYHAGNIYNCRCYPVPVLRPEREVRWPAKVYIDGQVRRMTLSEFKNIH